MQYDEHANGKEISVSANEEFEVALPETRTAGYRWVIAKNGEPQLRLLDETTAPNTAAVGGTGRHLWRFRAVSTGETELSFQYLRPWDKQAEPARAFQLKVRVGS